MQEPVVARPRNHANRPAFWAFANRHTFPANNPWVDAPRTPILTSHSSDLIWVRRSRSAPV